jgi:threonine/homoserine/homoserine lactone efflux protein
MEYASLFLLSFGVGFSGAMMPGPLLAVGIAETPRNGWRTGPILSVGHAIAEIAIVALLALGVATLVEGSSLIPSIIAIAGGAALILMGVMMAYDILRGNVSYDIDSADGKAASRRLIGKGITASLSNPFWFVWWATTGLAFVTKSLTLGVMGPVVFYFGHILSDFVWYSAVSVIVWQGKRILVGWGMKLLILGCAAFLVYLGIDFVIDGITGAGLA